MKKIFNLALALTFCLVTQASLLAQQGSEIPLTNASVVKLVRAGFREKTVIAIIHSRPNRFNLDPDRLIELKRGGVSENIILAMLSQDDSFVADGEQWSDDSFFRDNQKTSGAGAGDSPAGSTDIFGSSGGSRGETRTRGGSGGSQGDSVTTGSATVRIIRPPSEAGGGPPKLEKTPTLTNDSIVRLVDAGFSEGTIIKRIEDSPAEFDLSTAALADLRKHRVSDPIINAMTAAMSEEPGSKPNGPGRNRESQP
jgi:hypothetical protein